MELWRYQSTASRSPVAGCPEQIIPPPSHALQGTGFDIQSSQYSSHPNICKISLSSAQYMNNHPAKCVTVMLWIRNIARNCSYENIIFINPLENRFPFCSCENENKETNFLVVYSWFPQRCSLCMIMWEMCHVFSSAAWCYQIMNPPMEFFKVKAMPWLQLITCKITSLFTKRHCWTTRD